MQTGHHKKSYSGELLTAQTAVKTMPASFVFLANSKQNVLTRYRLRCTVHTHSCKVPTKTFSTTGEYQYTARLGQEIFLGIVFETASV